MPRSAADMKDRYFWATVEKYRKIAGISPSDLAKRCGISNMTYYRRRQDGDPTRREMQAMIRTLNIPVDEIAKYAL